jgi:hypothetical protein
MLQPAEETLVKTDSATISNTDKCVQVKKINVFSSVVSVFITDEITVIGYDGTCS